MKKVAILGSTGSIGVQALNIIENYPDQFEVVALAAGGQNVELFKSQCKKFLSVKNAANCATSAVNGFEAVIDLADTKNTGADIVLNAIAGNIGLEPSLRVLEDDAILALANKESMVVGGSLIGQQFKSADKMLQKIRPVDSEHSAIWQCLDGRSDVAKLILTASGGPFRGRKLADLVDVTPEMALNHPTWNMGPLVTINSSTLMNKGLELIEAAYLFDVDPDDIQVTVHPQSIVHSMVQFMDGSTIAQQSIPSMELPIALSLSYPQRLVDVEEPLDWSKSHTLQFEPLDNTTFPAVQLARHALKSGPLYPALMNKINEQQVYKFLAGEIAYTQIIPTVEESLTQFNPNIWATNPTNPTLEEIKHLLAA
ncbi:1-deoxy-D-xylulose 5-phosphate reductoisomerase [Actinomycetota bacterium]|nr:1-deoxy-D-xylulose 5-phosphate reductoisomerase [Actinomycetota bacterium]